MLKTRMCSLSLGIKFGDIFRHVPELQIPSIVASVNLLCFFFK